MLCAFKTIVRQAAHHARCHRQRRCIPSLTESASCLEDRVLLSAAGGKARAAEIAPNPVDTKAGKEVVNLFESILHTNPTSAQLTRSVRELSNGMSVVALRKDLTAEARAQQGAQGPALHERRRHQQRSVRPCDDFDEVGRDRGNHTGLVDAGPTGSDPYGHPADQALSDTRRDERLALVFAGVQSTMTFSSSSPAASSMSGTMSPTSTMTGMSSTTMTGMSSTTGMSMSSIGSIGSTQAAFADMGATTTMMATGM